MAQPDRQDRQPDHAHAEATADRRPSRRIVFTGLGSLGVAAVLAGCGGTQDAGGTEPPSGGGEAGGSGSSPSVPAGKELAKTADIPVEGGVILAGDSIVITQPRSGTFEAFSARCTHQGFTVTSVTDGTIECDHHGSQYDASDGSVTRGPASQSLAAVQIQVKGGAVFAA